jgi:integrase/recombinase XerC/integrase/recombinase XerD
VHNQALSISLDWLRAEGRSTRLDDLGENETRYFTIHLQNRPGVKGPASSHTVNNRVRSLRVFFGWLNRKGYTETHRLKDLEVPKPRQKEIEILTDEEIKSIFSSLDPDTPLGGRDNTIFSLMLDTGLRLSEVGTLKYDDVHLDKGYVKALGKGDKERIVSFGAECRRSLYKYVENFRIASRKGEAEAFFVCIDGHPLSSDGVRSFIKRLSKAADVPRLHAHLIRHTYATRFLLNGGNVFLLQENLGHESLAWSRDTFTLPAGWLP